MARILLIDDTPEIAELLTFALRDYGFDVVTTGFDSEVATLVDEHRPDALVLDCSVYQMSETLFDALRGHEAHAALPIVIVSDTPEKADASLRRRNAERVLLIPKPFTAGHVARALSQLVDSRPAPAGERTGTTSQSESPAPQVPSSPSPVR